MSEIETQVDCPFCKSRDVELFSLFGQQLMTVQYYCNSCRTAFERVKGPDVISDAEERVRRQGTRDG